MRAAAFLGTCAAPAPANASSTARRIGLIPLHYSIWDSLCTSAEEAVGGDPGPQVIRQRRGVQVVAERFVNLRIWNEAAAAGGGAFHETGGADLAVAGEFEANVIPELVPADGREAQSVSLEECEPAAEVHDAAAAHWPPAFREAEPGEAAADEQGGKPEIDDGRAAAVVHMAVQIEVVRQHAQPELDRVARLDPRPPQPLADRQQQAEVEIHVVATSRDTPGARGHCAAARRRSRS